jgi:murein endopeptidase
MVKILVKASLILSLTFGLGQPIYAAEPIAKKQFGAMSKGSNQRARPFGGYAMGCLAGGAQLAETGPTWQAMRLSRNRNWGHPKLDGMGSMLGICRNRVAARCLVGIVRIKLALMLTSGCCHPKV